MKDLHIHTVYSDGYLDFEEIIRLSNQMEKISITDHNSVAFYLELRNEARKNQKVAELVEKFIVGTELTIEGYPDYLMFFSCAKIISDNFLQSLECELKKIREAEAFAVQKAYEFLGYKNWNADFSKVSLENVVELEARTKDLAAICYFKRTGKVNNGYFEAEDLRTARIARRSISNMEEYGNPFEIASKKDGLLVLAHPIRTAIKNSGRSNDYEKTESALADLLTGFAMNGGKVIEWEFLDGEIDSSVNRYPVLEGHYKEIRDKVRKAIDQYDFKCIWGSDTHRIHPEYYRNWENTVMADLNDRLPNCFC